MHKLVECMGYMIDDIIIIITVLKRTTAKDRYTDLTEQHSSCHRHISLLQQVAMPELLKIPMYLMPIKIDDL